MTEDLDANGVAEALLVSIRLLVRRVRQVQLDGELTLPQISALARLDRGGPSTSSALARLEQISPQSMGSTLGGLEARALVERHPDPDDGRRVVLSVTEAGRQVLRSRRSAKAEQVAHVLTSEFDRSELERLMAVVPLIERLTQRL